MIQEFHMRLICILTLLVGTSVLMAEETAAAVAEGQTLLTGNWLVDIAAIIASLLGAALTAYTTAFMARKSAEAKERLQDANLSKLERLRFEVESIIYDVVGNINRKYLPILVHAVANKQITKREELKNRLKSLGDEALNQIMTIGGQRGIDIIGTLGKDWVITKIRSVVDEKSPFLGDTAESLLNGGADWLLDQGKKYLESKGVTIPDGQTPPPIIPEGEQPVALPSPING